MNKENDISILKKDFRKKIKFQLSEFTEDFFTSRSDKICKRILEWKIYQESNSVLFFMPLKTEPNILEVIEDALENKKNCYIPKVNCKNNMDFFLLNSNDKIQDQLEAGYFNILEPKSTLDKLDIKNFIQQNDILIFVPALAFDKNKNRIGKGKGFYDRFLSNFLDNDKKNIFFAGISFDKFIFDEIPTEKNDIKMDYLISDCKIF